MLDGGIVEVRVIEPDRQRTEEAVEIDDLPAGDRIMDPAAAAFFEVDDNLEAINEDVLLEFTHHAAGAAVAD